MVNNRCKLSNKYTLYSPIEDEDPFLEIEEINDLIKILAERKEQIWLPHFLRSRTNI